MKNKTRFLMIIAITLSFLTIPYSSILAADVTLFVGNGSGLLDTQYPVGSVEISLDNFNDEIGGAQFDVCDVGDYIACVNCELTERTTMFDCIVLELPNGCCRVIIVCKNPGCSIAKGTGNIVTIIYSVDVSLGWCTTLNPQNEIMSDDEGYSLEVSSLAGIFCPADSDQDGIFVYDDNCPETPNGLDKGTCLNLPFWWPPCMNDNDCVGEIDSCSMNQADEDQDSIGDACDNCPSFPSPDQEDIDEDGVGNVCDNCPINYNPVQADSDGDGIGDVCDCGGHGECGLCQKCEGGACVFQTVSEDIKGECPDEECTTGVCNGTGACGFEPTGTLCADDGNICTDDQCDGVGVCMHPNNSDSCDDGNLCTVSDTCDAGTCGGTAKDCSSLDDQCNLGVCDPGTGDCIQDSTPHNGDPCDDGDLCTIDDTCNNGACDGTGKDCSSLSDQCNVGICDAGTGNCIQDSTTYDGNPCDNGQVGTLNDTCSDGVCTGSIGAASIPTLSEWGMIIFMTIIMGIGVVTLFRRRML